MTRVAQPPRPAPAGSRALLLLVALPLAPALLSAWLHPRRPDWAALRTEAAAPAPGRLGLAAIHAEHADALWLDARPAADYAAGHVPGALPLTEDAWEELFASVIEAWDGRRSLIVYCGAKTCQTSETVARRLRRELGFENVYVLEGGWEAWRAAEGRGVADAGGGEPRG